MPRPDPDALLADLDPEQREAVLAASGPVAILAGAGSGKTRVLSRRAAYAIATGVVPADQALVVTFTDKAAGEMVERLRSLGLPGVTARTFHAHALSQLRFFWPLRHDGAPLPELLDSKAPILGRLARQLPGHYRFTPAKDLADEVEWAKARRVTPRDYERQAAAGGREPPIPVDLFVRVFDGYEHAKARAGRIDFDDLLVGTVDLLETDADAAATVRARKRWFSVDEYQDTSPLQQRLLELWLGESLDLGVVGDEDQTIYSFTGASPAYLRSFADRWPGATGRVARPELPLHAAGARPRQPADRGRGTLEAPGADARRRAGAHDLAPPVRRARAGGTVHVDPRPAGRGRARGRGRRPRPDERAARADRGGADPGRRRIPGPRDPLLRPPGGAHARSRACDGRRSDASGRALAAAIRERWAEAVGFEEDGDAVEGDEARERQASLETLLAIVDELVGADPAADVAGVLADLDARAAHEREGSAGGVNLLTYHRAKGLEWDAVFLPSLEEGILPIRQARDDDDALAEERRLLYVGITRARVHLALSWAERRETRGREGRRQPSRFLLDLRPRPGTARSVSCPVRPFRRPRPSTPPMGRCSRPCAPGARPAPAPTRCRRT